jgi:hypothetical protein
VEIVVQAGQALLEQGRAANGTQVGKQRRRHGDPSAASAGRAGR